VLLAMPYAFNKYLLVLNAGKNICPAYGGKADKIDSFGVMELVLGAHVISERSKLEHQLQISSYPVICRRSVTN